MANEQEFLRPQLGETNPIDAAFDAGYDKLSKLTNLAAGRAAGVASRLASVTARFVKSSCDAGENPLDAGFVAGYDWLAAQTNRGAEVVVDIADKAAKKIVENGKKGLILGAATLTVAGGVGELGLSNAAAASAPSASGQAADTHPGRFSPGETVGEVAKQDGFTIAQFAAKNPGVNVRWVYTNRTYNFPNTAVPVPATAPAPTAAPVPANSINTAPTIVLKPGRFAPGQNVTVVGKEDGFTPEEFKEANPNVSNINVVFPGRTYNFPIHVAPSPPAAPTPAQAAPAPANAPNSTAQITLKSGEDWWWLAEQGARVSGKNVITELHEIEADNPGEKASDLPVGSNQNVPAEVAQDLQPKPETAPAAPTSSPTPAPAPPPVASEKVTIRPDDTMSGLAVKAGNPGFVGQIEALNPGVDPKDMQPGQTLNVPPAVAQADQAPAPPAQPMPVTKAASGGSAEPVPAAPAAPPPNPPSSKAEQNGAGLDRFLRSYLITDEDATENGAAGILGNGDYESGMQPERLEGSPYGAATPLNSLSPAQINNPKLGGGIWQFTPISKLLDYAEQTNQDPNDPLTQLKLVVLTLKSGDGSAWNYVMSSDSPEQAAERFMNVYEHPLQSAANASSKARQQYARNDYDQSPPTAPAATTTTTTPPPSPTTTEPAPPTTTVSPPTTVATPSTSTPTKAPTTTSTTTPDTTPTTQANSTPIRPDRTPNSNKAAASSNSTPEDESYFNDWQSALGKAA